MKNAAPHRLRRPRYTYQLVTIFLATTLVGWLSASLVSRRASAAPLCVGSDARWVVRLASTEGATTPEAQESLEFWPELAVLQLSWRGGIAMGDETRQWQLDPVE